MNEQDKSSGAAQRYLYDGETVKKTVNLEATVYLRAKELASEQRRSLSFFVNEALRRQMGMDAK
jgi:hypothetical protein